MFVPKSPLRADFCGMPPCPLCFDWVDGEDARVDGMMKMGQDLLGPDVTPTEEQYFTLREAAERIHLNNLDKLKLTPEQIRDQQIADNEQAEKERLNKIRMDAFLKAKRKEAETATKPRQKTIDEMDPATVEKLTKPTPPPTVRITRSPYDIENWIIEQARRAGEIEMQKEQEAAMRRMKEMIEASEKVLAKPRTKPWWPVKDDTTMWMNEVPTPETVGKERA